jgi:hypothetical protein
VLAGRCAREGLSGALFLNYPVRVANPDRVVQKKAGTEARPDLFWEGHAQSKLKLEFDCNLEKVVVL